MADLEAINAIKAVADTIKATVDAVKAVEDALTSERAVVLEIDNVTGLTIQFDSADHEHGGFQAPPPFSVPDKQAALFSSQSSGLFVGTQGHAIYIIDQVTRLIVSWDNPFAGNNSCDATVEGEHRNRYVSASICGNGNHAQARFLIGRHEGPFSVKQIFKETGTDPSKGIRQFFPEHTVVNLRTFMKI